MDEPRTELPPAFELIPRLTTSATPPFVFLDFDGTLTPLVDAPGSVELGREARRIIERLAEQWPVAIISGRDIEDLRERVDIPGLVYAGTHGLEVSGPGGWSEERGLTALDALAHAEEEIRAELRDIPGVFVERKHLGIAVHHRMVATESVPQVRAAVRRAGDRHPGLRRLGSKDVFELLPDIDWNKGSALIHIADMLGWAARGTDRVIVYVGDDRTDEDAFEAVRGRGFGVIVGRTSRPTAATHRLKDPAEVMAFLTALIAPDPGP